MFIVILLCVVSDSCFGGLRYFQGVEGLGFRPGGLKDQIALEPLNLGRWVT